MYCAQNEVAGGSFASAWPRPKPAVWDRARTPLVRSELGVHPIPQARPSLPMVARAGATLLAGPQFGSAVAPRLTRVAVLGPGRRPMGWRPTARNAEGTLVVSVGIGSLRLTRVPPRQGSECDWQVLKARIRCNSPIDLPSGRSCGSSRSVLGPRPPLCSTPKLRTLCFALDGDARRPLDMISAAPLFGYLG